MAYNHEAPVLCCGFSKDGQRVFSGGCDNKARSTNHSPFGVRAAGVDPCCCLCVLIIYDMKLSSYLFVTSHVILIVDFSIAHFKSIAYCYVSSNIYLQTLPMAFLAAPWPLKFQVKMKVLQTQQEQQIGPRASGIGSLFPGEHTLKKMQKKDLQKNSGNWVMATQIFYMFIPKIGEDVQFDEHIFQMGWFNHQPV